MNQAPSTPLEEPCRRFPGVVRSWYAVQTQVHSEDLAEHTLQRVCERVFCPRYRQRVILHGYRREVTRPLFPQYMFAAFDFDGDFHLVQYARGVRGVVRFGSEPAAVPPELIGSIESRMESGYVVLQMPPLHFGQRCEIIAGGFEGYTGIFQAHRSGAERVMILLDTLKYNARVVVDRAAVRAL